MSADSNQIAGRLASLRVLVVDDEHYMRKVVRTMLMSIGVRTVMEAPDGAAALELIRSHPLDVVVLDWEMPGLDGLSVVRLIRSRAPFPIPMRQSSCLPATASARGWSRG